VEAATFQARSPVFAGEVVDLAGQTAGPGLVRLAARHDGGGAAMTCEVTLRL
jgi:hypothetical protein